MAGWNSSSPADDRLQCRKKGADTETKTLTTFVEKLPDVRTVDLGKIPSGEKVSRILRIENKTTDAMKISGVDASCGCVGVEFETESVAPGDSFRIAVSVTANAREDYLKQLLKVRFERSSVDLLQIGIRAPIVKKVSLSPKAISFKDLSSAKSLEIKASDNSVRLIKCHAVRGVVKIVKQEVMDSGRMSIKCLTEANVGQAVEVIRVEYELNGNVMRDDCLLAVATPKNHMFFPRDLDFAEVGSEASLRLVFTTNIELKDNREIKCKLFDINGDRVGPDKAKVMWRIASPRLVQFRFRSNDERTLVSRLVVEHEGERFVYLFSPEKFDEES